MLVKKIPIFENFRKWKAFRRWKVNVSFDKFQKCRKFLRENLFIVNESLCPALLNVQEMCHRISEMSLCKIEQNHTCSLKEFKKVQLNQLQEVSVKLKTFRDLVKEVVRTACRTALLEAGFTPDDYYFDNGENNIGEGHHYDSQGYDYDIFDEAPEKMTYTEQANKRSHCKRLTCFIRLADYLVVNTMHTLAVNSVSTLLNNFMEQIQNTPSEESNNSDENNENNETSAKLTDETLRKPTVLSQFIPEEDSKRLIPLFLTELVLERNQLYFDPDVNSFQSNIQEVIRHFQDTVLGVPNLIPDNYFDAFTQPIINGKFEEKTCGEGPSLSTMFEEDKYLHQLVINIQDTLTFAFNAANQYSNDFTPFLQFYQENEKFDSDKLQEESDLDVQFFSESLKHYHMQHKMAGNIQKQRQLGLLLIDATKMKQLFIPSPIRCLNIINNILPRLAREKVEKLLSELQDGQFQLEFQPSSTEEYVKNLTFLNQIQERIEPLEDEAVFVKQLYDLIDIYDVQTPPEDLAVYQTLLPSINTVRDSIDKALADRDSNLNQLSNHIDEDITELNKEVKETKKIAMDQMLLNVESEKEKVKSTLKKLLTEMASLQNRASVYKSYQKDFNLEVTKFEELDEVYSELKMKDLLWRSFDDWENHVETWNSALFETLEPDLMISTTSRYLKTVTMLEKGLPPNTVVPVLRNQVEDIKEKLPIVTHLRNCNLKPRHWEKLENILDCKLQDGDELTLRKLTEMKADQYIAQFEEISSQATAEYNLELILKKVEESWKSVELTVLSYKDYKDTYILGGTDDIQQLWEDSNINITTISSSKYVGPIKSRVEEWQRQMELFGKTLDEWLLCQRSWLYLESVFNAADIQRQLPSEDRMFRQVDKSYKDIMRKVQKVPLAMRAVTQPGLLETFQMNNSFLDAIHKCLETYLESKRMVFPRFYFLSNDELLEILSQTKNVQAVQRHLLKCFNAKLEFKEIAQSENADELEIEDKLAIQYSNEIIGMISPEGEKVGLGKGLKSRGNVEEWLGKVEEAMFLNIRKLLKSAMLEYHECNYEQWVLLNIQQVTLTISQIIWCRCLTHILAENANVREKLKVFEETCFKNLNKLAELVSGGLDKLARSTLCALITIEVHARDIVSNLIEKDISNCHSFEWQKQLRYYWEVEQDTCVVHMCNSNYIYGYEYLGASSRLVITPLTDRCYICLMGAVQLDLGGAPLGPAGTGKTETTKDLAKSLAKQCVVFNCSDGLDYKLMGRFFSGLAQSGVWCCFDEFNRINIEVLSVIAQQLVTIKNAKSEKLSRFMFEGREIKLVASCATFITMNPDYAGRTELPDNLKALFRPISMMVPDYCLIAEVILYSEGFLSSKILAQKITQMYKLCSEQLSQQDHYDFGMRAIKSVLVMAGSSKRQNTEQNENLLLIRSLRDSNLPKFLKEDADLFQAILQDLFPGNEVPANDYGNFESEILNVMKENNLEPVNAMVKKVIELYETMLVRHGVMLIGPTGGGKTTIYQILKDVLTNLHTSEEANSFYRPVFCFILNPKSLDIEELYGGINKVTMEWHDGLLALAVRAACNDTSDNHQWVICDGPVDALWIENMNTVLDDNKMLCLANSERIQLTPYIHMMFEVQDLAAASPATVSRCGMVYIDTEQLKWMPYVKKWVKIWSSKLLDENAEYLFDLFEKYIEKGLQFINKCQHTMQQVDISKVMAVCKLLESLLFYNDVPINFYMDPNKLNPLLCASFIFSYLWGLGGSILESHWDAFDSFIRNLFEDNADARLPVSGDLWSCYIDFESRRFEFWDKIVPSFKYDRNVPYYNIVVQTVDTIRYGYLLQKFLCIKHPVLLTGDTGVGKSLIAHGLLNKMAKNGGYVPVYLNFSAQTSSQRTQEMIETKLEKKRKNILGAPQDKRIIIFIDDLNLPKPDDYGCQKPIELLRQFLDFGGFYDREKLFWKEIMDVTLSAACGPPGAGRNPVTARFIRHFTILSIPSPSENNLQHIFMSILTGFFQDFHQNVRNLTEGIVSAAVDIFNQMKKAFLPTPTKSHYIFNLRDLSKCIQGILQCDSGYIRDRKKALSLFCHETLRIFHDRLINSKDKLSFYNMLSDMVNKHFGEIMNPEAFIENPILFGDFHSLQNDKSNQHYEELPEQNKIQYILQEYLTEFNIIAAKDMMKLVFFMDAIENITRIARILCQQRGNGLMVGVGGTGKQSLTRLAAHICGYKCFQIQLTQGYDYTTFREDLIKIYNMVAAENESTVFLFTDTQIVVEDMLEDISNILNSGEVPNLLEPEDLEKLIIACRPAAKEAGIPEGNRDMIYDFCINRVRNNLHIVLCMSPVGNAFRTRCQTFPSFVNCCTINWFTEWPKEALLNVAESFFDKLDFDDTMKTKLSAMCVEIHVSVTSIAERFRNELKRCYYTTPTSYLELINLYLSMLNDRSNSIKTAEARVKNGVKKLLETNELVAKMKKELVALEPELKQKSANTNALMEKLVLDQDKVDSVRKVVVEDEAIAKAKTEETQAIANDAQRDLDEALPALEDAIKALDSLDKSDISEIRVFTNPPELVQTVLEAVCILMNQRTDWSTAKAMLGEPNFLRKMVEYDKDHITDGILKKLKKYIDNPKFRPEFVEKTSKACRSMCMWVRAMDLYAHIHRTVEPKRQRLSEAQAELDIVTETLNKKQQRLAEVEAQINELQEIYDQSLMEKQNLERKMTQTAARLKRASKLTTALADEQERWRENIEEFNNQLCNVTGDVFISAACVAYYGAFTNNYRMELVDHWSLHCKQLEIPISDDFSLKNIMADPFEIQQWHTDGLPRDQVSIENAILATRGHRWPLMIDPQEQGGQLVIRIGDSDIQFDMNFHLYLTTKIPNPQYLPDVCTKVTIINFMVTKSGLENQILSDVVRLERPDLENQRNQLIVRINADNNQLKASENRILKLLFESEGNILDNEELINTLNSSKITSKVIKERLKEAEQTEQNISTAREKYRPVATRGSIIYFVVADMAEIDPMYQFSLKYFKQLFNLTIKNTKRAEDLQKRIQMLICETTKFIYKNVSRALFENHKLVFSFILCIGILKHEGKLTNEEWNYFLRGAPVMNENFQNEFPVDLLNQNTWNAAVELSNNFQIFSTLVQDITHYPVWVNLGDTQIHANPEIKDQTDLNLNNQSSPSKEWQKDLSSFQKLLFIKAFCEEKTVLAVTEFVCENLGQEYVESRAVDLQTIYNDMKKEIPLVFVLSTGSDPMNSLMRFAKEKNYSDRISAISLGQAQGPLAEALIKEATKTGDWVFLQNCHLAASWMPSMEETLKALTDEPEQIHDDFRLFLSSKPSKHFPISVLQNSIKVTNEPPKGIKANIRRAFGEISLAFFEDHILSEKWQKMVFGLCFFHAVIQERKKFGPLGWNIKYEFSDSDRECALNKLKIFCTDGIPWEALNYVIGDITYGGRVTNSWDQRCLRTILNNFFNPKILQEDYRYSSSGIYYSPTYKTLEEHLSYIEELPQIDHPEIFGLHENANVAFQKQETTLLMQLILDIQPKVPRRSDGQSNDDIVLEVADNILGKLIDKLDIISANSDLFKVDSNNRKSPLTIFLLQEVTHFNKLLWVIKNSLDHLQRAIKGLIVMTDELEQIYISCLNNHLPKVWSGVAYPSLKPLSSWITDLNLRCSFMESWIKSGTPYSFWISGFFFPQGFLTAVLQNHSRKYQLPIDYLSFNFNVLHVQNPNEFRGSVKTETSVEDTQPDTEKSDGVFIHGLFMEGFRWDKTEMHVIDSQPGEIHSPLPLLHLIPARDVQQKDETYCCPIYKTALRADGLSSTGRSTNFITSVFLPTKKPEDYWIANGAALLCQLSE
eukprot:XP_014781277.1 PREDICTED: dynein heavy chain 6, axonemal-like [Octopus bimaculoides]